MKPQRDQELKEMELLGIVKLTPEGQGAPTAIGSMAIGGGGSIAQMKKELQRLSTDGIAKQLPNGKWVMTQYGIYRAQHETEIHPVYVKEMQESRDAVEKAFCDVVKKEKQSRDVKCCLANLTALGLLSSNDDEGRMCLTHVGYIVLEKNPTLNTVELTSRLEALAEQQVVTFSAEGTWIMADQISIKDMQHQMTEAEKLGLAERSPDDPEKWRLTEKGRQYVESLQASPQGVKH